MGTVQIEHITKTESLSQSQTYTKTYNFTASKDIIYVGLYQSRSDGSSTIGDSAGGGNVPTTITINGNTATVTVGMSGGYRDSTMTTEWVIIY